MNDEIEERWKKEATYIIKENATIRQTAKKFGVSKSTVYKDITLKLPLVNPKLAQEVKEVLDKNKKERSFRAGKVIREKYQMAKAK